MDMIENPPKISVLMSVYNGSPTYLRESIDSILQQSFAEFEFIIIDDCSSDGSHSILSDYASRDRRIRLFRNEQNMGLTKSLNKGLNLAQGDYIARQDADDISLLTRFEKQVAWLADHPETVLIASEIQRIRPDGTFGAVSDRACSPDLLAWHLLFHNHLGGHSQVMFRRQPVIDLGGYNEAYRYSQDYELWCRLAAVGKLEILPEALLQQRFHNASISASKRSQQSALVFQQIARNLEPLLGRALSPTEIEPLHCFWSVEKTAKRDRFPEHQLARQLSRQLSRIYQAYISQQPPATQQALRQLIAQKFLAWASVLNRRTQPWSKLQVYQQALHWSPQQALTQAASVFSKPSNPDTIHRVATSSPPAPNAIYRVATSSTLPPKANTNPVISVIMPVYNSRQYLDAAVKSILQQSFKDFELLIFDDGSTDGSRERLQYYAQKDPRIQLFLREHGGLTLLLNEGLQKAKGTFIARMDSDDISLRNRFEVQLAFLKAHSDCVAVGSEILRIDPSGLPIGVKGQPIDHEGILQAFLQGKGGVINHPSVMFPRAALERIDGYNRAMEPAEDFDLFIRLAEVGKLANLPEVLLKYRLHCNRTTDRKRLIQLEKVKEIVHRTWSEREMGTPPQDLLKSQPVLSPTASRKHWARTAISQGYVLTALKHSLILLAAKPQSLDRWKMVLRASKSWKRRTPVPHA